MVWLSTALLVCAIVAGLVLGGIAAQPIERMVRAETAADPAPARC